MQTLREVIIEIINETVQERHLDDISNWDNKSLVLMDCLLKFRCAEGVMRLLGVAEGADWRDVYQEALCFAGSLTPDVLVKLFLQTDDGEGVAELTILRVDRDITKNEINSRIEQRPFGKKVFEYYLDENKTLELLKSTQAPIRGFLGTLMKVDKETHRIRNIYITGNPKIKHILSDIKENGSPTLIEQLIKLENGVEKIEASPFLDCMGGAFEGWGEVAPLIFQEVYQSTLGSILPILQGTADKVPVRIYSKHKNIFEKQIERDALGHKEEELLREDEDGKEETAEDYFDRKQFEALVQGNYEYAQSAGLLEMIDVKMKIQEIVNKSKNPQKTTKAVKMLVEGHLREDIVRETGLSKRQIQIYQSEIKEARQ